MTEVIPHPSNLTRAAGLSETPAAIVICSVALLQYVFLARLWDGYLLSFSGEAIAQSVVITANVVAILGGCFICLFMTRRWIVTRRAAICLEKDARSETFDGVRRAMDVALRRSDLAVRPGLRYTPKNANALETRQEWLGGEAAIVVGLNQRERAVSDFDVLTAQIGHEISHIELMGTGLEVMIRRVVALHFALFGWLLATFAVSLGFIDRTGLTGAASFWDVTPVFDRYIFIGLSSQFFIIALSCSVVFAYSYYYVVRREHNHDVRGSQLAGTDALARELFPRLIERQSWISPWRDFWTLHPSARSRKRVIERHDVLLISAFIYPGLVAGLQPVILLLVAGWRVYFGVDEVVWNIALTLVSGLLLYFALSADFVRLGLSLLLSPRDGLRFGIYALVAASATQVPRIGLEVSSGLRNGRTTGEIVSRVIGGLMTGGLNIVLVLVVLLLCLGYLTAANLAAFGLQRPRWQAAWSQVCALTLVLGAFTTISLQSSALLTPIVLAMVVIGLSALLPIALARCGNCRRRVLGSALLATSCPCGHDRLAPLRRAVSVSYRDQARSG